MPTYRPLTLAIAVLLVTVTVDAAAARELWSDAATSVAASTMRTTAVLPKTFRRVTLDADALAEHARDSRGSAQRIVALPLPDGGTTEFELEDSGVLPPGLAARFPRLGSLKGHDSNGRRVRLDLTAEGLHAVVRDRDGDWIVQPEAAGKPTGRSPARSHIVFRRADAPSTQREEHSPATDAAIDAVAALPRTATARGSATAVLRTFRIAMSATHSYTRHMGGTMEDGLAGIVRTVNRVNEIFENDLGVHLVLAEGNDRLVFTKADADPFAKVAGDDLKIALLNVKVAEEALGKDAFDVGHVVDGQRDAGVAGAIGNTCQPWSGKYADRGRSKAAGMTGSTRPFEDAFHVDFVAHELGHQFGARHTFNGCGTGAREDDAAFAPGSGSTVMGYAGLCGSHDLQPHSDPYFHAANIDQIQSWLASVGGTCAKGRLNTSPAPLLDTEGWNRPLVVPARTPFRLTGLARFADPASRLTYTFEQMDLGDMQETGEPLSDMGSGPLFRSRPPNNEGEQTFPSMAVLLGEEPIGRGDALPETPRDLRFRLTARDNRDFRSHVVSAERTVRIVDTGKSFAVTLPKAGATLQRGKARQIRWDVAGTVAAPVSCSRVQIDLSLDGGRSFLDVPLAEDVPNKGRATIAIPDSVPASRRARLRVGCADGRFFALSPGEMTLR
ncbi:reprolysin-like metallopeptidase [Luteibacter yeojuensis]